MLLLITFKNDDVIQLNNLNTSNVTVNLNVYKILGGNKINLNTSNVTVNRFLILSFSILYIYLNTSNVTVNRQIDALKEAGAEFKYI